MTVLVNSNGHPTSGPTSERTSSRYSWEQNETFWDTDLNQLMVYTGAVGGWKAADGSTGAISAVVNAANSAQNNAAPVIVWGFNPVDLADNTKAVVLPTPLPGRSLVIKNLVANKTLPVFPAANCAINLLGTNNAITMGNASVAKFWAFNSTQWYTEPAVPS